MENLIPPFNAYKGSAPYIFVSYAHKNSEIVYAHITSLHNEGFRIWYDEGIDPGADWSDEIASALVHAEVFLVFISDAAVASQNVRKEIVFAIDQKKHMICVHVEETDLPTGLKMQLGNIQALLENRFHDKGKFYDRLFNALLPEKTRGDERADLPVKDVPRKTKTSTIAGQSTWTNSKSLLLGLFAAAFFAAAVFGGIALMQRPGGELAFADRNLESALRAEMQKPRGVIEENDLVSFRGRLDLSGKNITDISPLRHMTGLSILNLENNNIVDISPIGGLQEIMILSIGNNRISDIASLRGLRNSLIGLSLENNPIEDLKQLRPLANLEVLDLSGVIITDLELGRYLRRLRIVMLTEDGHGLNAEDLRRFRANLPPNCEIQTAAAGTSE